MPAAKKARASERSETPVAAVKKARASRRSELLATPVLAATPTHAKYDQLTDNVNNLKVNSRVV